MPDRFMVTNTATTKKTRCRPGNQKHGNSTTSPAIFSFFYAARTRKTANDMNSRHKFSFCVFYIFAASECIKQEKDYKTF